MGTTKSRVQILVEKYSSSLGLAFQQLLPETFLADALDEEKIKYRHRTDISRSSSSLQRGSGISWGNPSISSPQL